MVRRVPSRLGSRLALTDAAPPQAAGRPRSTPRRQTAKGISLAASAQAARDKSRKRQGQVRRAGEQRKAKAAALKDSTNVLPLHLRRKEAQEAAAQKAQKRKAESGTWSPPLSSPPFARVVVRGVRWHRR